MIQKQADKKQDRTILSFEPDEDVLRMIDRTRTHGIKIVHTCNQALRSYLIKNGFGGKKDQSSN